MRIKPWHIALFVVALMVFAIARAPAAFFLPQRPGALNYSDAEGTVWDAQLSSVALGPYRVASATWRLSPIDLVQGKAVVPIALRGGDLEGDLMLLGNRHGDRRVGVSALRVNGLPFAGRMLPGETRFQGLDILFEDGACARAHGRVESDVLVRAGESLGWAGPSLAGNAACEGNNARIALMGATEGGERVTALILLMPDGAASWRLSVFSRRDQTLAALSAAGFTRSAADGTLGYGEDTRWLP